MYRTSFLFLLLLFLFPLTVNAQTITEEELIILTQDSYEILEELDFANEFVAQDALSQAMNYIETLNGDINVIYNNLKSAMDNLKINDPIVKINQISNFNNSIKRGVNLDSYIDILIQNRQKNENLIEYEYGFKDYNNNILTDDEFLLFLKSCNITTIQLTLTNDNLSEIIKLISYANSIEMEVYIINESEILSALINNDNINIDYIQSEDKNDIDLANNKNITTVSFNNELAKIKVVDNINAIEKNTFYNLSSTASTQEEIDEITLGLKTLNEKEGLGLFFISKPMFTDDKPNDVLKAFNKNYLKYGTFQE